ncbi:MAG: hypothetical protein RIB45_11810 [Marivibrio sp.]|uniref:hypothetical protein n=1 Tax=Marivibrio sp. TaxID=2039719 RepID=UPI0032ECB5FC
MMLTKEAESARERIANALSRVARMRDDGGRVLVDLPIMYPSGAMVVVEVEINRGKCFVSDMGSGLVEAEFAAAESFYAPAAKEAAEDFSVSFDGHSMFALWVPETATESAIICVANASCKAAAEAVRRAAEAKSKHRNEQIFERISTVFGPKNVAKEAEVTGRHAKWNAHNVIALPKGGRAVFEFMSKSPVSVSSKFLMFTDIREANPSFSLNAVVKSIDTLDDKAQMVGDVANIVSLNASDEDFIRYARAA